MGRPISNRIFSKIERKIWRNRTFRLVLSDDAQKLWLYLLSSPRATRCPGLISASLLNIMEDLGWNWRGIEPGAPQHEKIIKGLTRTSKALDELAQTIKEDDGTQWIKWDDNDQLVFMPRGILHHLPDNADQVRNWIQDLKEYPDTTIKKEWLNCALDIFKTRYTKDDTRFSLLDSYRRSVVSKTNDLVKSKTKKRDPKEQLPLKEPSDLTPKQNKYYEMLKRVDFYVRGKGIMKAADAVPDPVRLAKALGDEELYPNVDAGLIGRLGAWSIENKTRAKTETGMSKFILNRASYSQERGGTRTNDQSTREKSKYPHGGDLATKINNAK